MITAIVTIYTAADAIPEVAQAVADVPGVSEAYSVSGDGDIIAMVRVRRLEEIADVIADRISKVPGVVSTRTHIAFRAYSRHDLAAAFGVAADD